MTPHGGSSSSSSPPDFITRGAAMGGGGGGTIQHFHAGAFAAGSNIYLAAPGGQSDAGGSHAHAAQLAVVAKRQNCWVGNDAGGTSLVETFHFRKQFSVSQPCGAGCWCTALLCEGSGSATRRAAAPEI